VAAAGMSQNKCFPTVQRQLLNWRLVTRALGLPHNEHLILHHLGLSLPEQPPPKIYRYRNQFVWTT
jgi:hypothetical protein